MSDKKIYGVAFDTKKYEKQAMVEVVQVTLETSVIGLDDAVNIDLCCHPLYPQLVQYVMANPARKA